MPRSPLSVDPHVVLPEETEIRSPRPLAVFHFSPSLRFFLPWLCFPVATPTVPMPGKVSLISARHDRPTFVSESLRHPSFFRKDPPQSAQEAAS